MKDKVILLCGGQSAEHEISLLSARNIWENLEAIGYSVTAFLIKRDGMIQRLEALPDQLGEQVSWSQVTAQEGIFFPVLHGTGGEDGTVQGLLELAGVPYVGCGVLASAVGMDKAIAKEVLRAAGVRVVPYRLVTADQWQADPDGVRAVLEAELGYPLFVKPANQGSSIGVSKVGDRGQLPRALDLAAIYDRRVVVEKGLTAREIECALLGNEEPEASLPGEIVSQRDFYDYTAKYQDGLAQMQIPAHLSPEVQEGIRRLAVEAFLAIDGAGLARVDFFLTPEGDLYLNEINTMPGFTRFSMYPVMWEKSGLPLEKVLERLLLLANRRHAQRKAKELR